MLSAAATWVQWVQPEWEREWEREWRRDRERERTRERARERESADESEQARGSDAGGAHTGGPCRRQSKRERAHSGRNSRRGQRKAYVSQYIHNARYLCAIYMHTHTLVEYIHMYVCAGHMWQNFHIRFFMTARSKGLLSFAFLFFCFSRFSPLHLFYSYTLLLPPVEVLFEICAYISSSIRQRFQLL